MEVQKDYNGNKQTERKGVVSLRLVWFVESVRIGEFGLVVLQLEKLLRVENDLFFVGNVFILRWKSSLEIFFDILQLEAWQVVVIFEFR